MMFNNWRRWLGKLLLLTLVVPAAVWAQTSPNPKLVEAAKKEGEVVYYTTMTPRSEQVGGRLL